MKVDAPVHSCSLIRQATALLYFYILFTCFSLNCCPKSRAKRQATQLGSRTHNKSIDRSDLKTLDFVCAHMTTLISDSSSSFSSIPSDASIATMSAYPHNGAAVSMTPTKSLTPRYVVLHNSGAPLQSLQPPHPTSRFTQLSSSRRETRHRVVEGGAPAEVFLEPLPQHLFGHNAAGTVQAAPQQCGLHRSASNVSDFRSQNGSSSHLPSAAHGNMHAVYPRASMSIGVGAASPHFRNLAVSSPTSSQASPVHFTSTQAANTLATLHHGSGISLCGQLPAATHSGSSTTGSCSLISTRYQPVMTAMHGFNGGQPPGVILNHLSVDSGKLVASPLSPGLGAPGSPQLPRPPSMSDRSLNPRAQRFPSVSPPRSTSGAVVLLQQPATSHGGMGSPLDTSPPEGTVPLSDDHGGHIVSLLNAIQRVDSLVSSSRQEPLAGFHHLSPNGAPVSCMSPPNRSTSFHRGRLLPQPVEALLRLDDVPESDSSTATPSCHLSPFSSLRLDNSQRGGDLPSPRLRTASVSPAAGVAGPVSSSAAAHNGWESPSMSPHGSWARVMSFAAAEVVVEGGIQFHFLPRDGAASIDSLDDELLQLSQSNGTSGGAACVSSQLPEMPPGV